MAFTSDELANIANAALDYYWRGETVKQSIQNKPLLKALDANKKFFPGGKENISIPVQGDFVSSDANFFTGYNTNDPVTFANPANIKRASYPWKEVNGGITCTFTELKIDGLSVDDSAFGKNVSPHSDRDLTVLTDLLENKMEDMAESWHRSLNTMLWLDGAQDSKEMPGIDALISETPNTGTTGGLNRATYSWWRNRAFVGVGTNATGAALVSSPSNQTLIKFFREEVRQLRRYETKTPKYAILCGSGFYSKLDAEVAEKGMFTQTGWSKDSATDIGMAPVSIPGIGTFTYDPTLDDLNKSNFCYFIDLNAIKYWAMTGEHDKLHYPARPYNIYALYRAITRTGGLAASKLNSSGVYEVAA